MIPFVPEEDALFDREPVVETEHLVIGKPGEAAVEAPNFILREGACALLEGESAGMHAFLEAVRLMRPVRSGTLRLLGRDARRASLAARAKMRARVALAGPSATLAPGLSLLDNIALPLRLAGVAAVAYRDTVEELILDFELAAEAKTLAALASPPARRAAIMARAIAARPSLLIAESPFAGLSSALQRRSVAVLAALKSDRTALLLVDVPPAAAEALQASRHEIQQGVLRSAREAVA